MAKAVPEREWKKLLCWDGNNVFRWNAGNKGLMNLSFNGKKTGAIYGTVKTIITDIANLQPDEAVVVFDGAGARAVKQKIHSGYKANRQSSMDDELHYQMNVARDILRAAGICVLQKAGVDGDDVMGALLALPNRSKIAVSNDKDFLQCVSDSCSQLRRIQGEHRLWTPEDVVEHFGVRPDQFADYLALMGDSVDGIPGLKQCGPEQAAELLTKYDSLARLLVAYRKHPSNFKPVLRERLAKQHKELLQFQQLTRLDTSVVKPAHMEQIVPRLVPKRYSEDLFPLLESHGLKKLRAWFVDHKPTVLQKPKGLWS